MIIEEIQFLLNKTSYDMMIHDSYDVLFRRNNISMTYKNKMPCLCNFAGMLIKYKNKIHVKHRCYHYSLFIIYSISNQIYNSRLG